MQKQLTAIIEREGNGYVALCPELDISSQGDSSEDARENLRETLELFFETAPPSEIQQRLHKDVYVTRVEVAVGYAARLLRRATLYPARPAWICGSAATRQPYRHAKEVGRYHHYYAGVTGSFQFTLKCPYPISRL